jgi:hypothetical protein
MRVVKNPQLQFGQVDISRIYLDPKSRDDIPQIIKGLQYIYITRSVREQIFELLEKHIAPQANKKNGRPGMELWKILVLGVLRLDLNCDYDRIHNLANSHSEIRQMLGHSDWYDKEEYHIQTIKDNVRLLTPELLDEINQIVVRTGHDLVKKKDIEVLHGRCDSFVVETHVHYPTDINLLYDAMRKIIQLTAKLCDQYECSLWRQSKYNIKQIKRLLLTVQNKKRSRGRTEEQKERCEAIIKEVHREYVKLSKGYLNKAYCTLEMFEKQGLTTIMDKLLIENIKNYMVDAERQIDQINRRVLQGERIAHDEKVFSIFQRHTEWISKGKAGIPVELGLRVCVMEKKTDDQVAVSMVTGTKKRFSNLDASSFDKGFHSKKNQEALSKELTLVALPRKGKLSQQAREIEGSKEFREARRKHSAVESCINALEVHGLDRCRDNGSDGFKRYVALAIVARNIQHIGAILQKRERKQIEKRKKKHYSANDMFKLAA